MAPVRIVIAHGRDSSWEVPGTTGPTWCDALRFGLLRSGMPRAKVNELEITYAAFGALWRPDAFEGPIGVLSEVELAVQLPPLSKVAYWAAQSALLGPITRSVLTRSLVDVFQYLGPGEYHDACNDVILSACSEPLSPGASPPDAVIIVGFSLGAIVAYETLRLNQDLKVKHLFTCGNPIGFGPIHQALLARAGDPTPFPSGTAWTNVWCNTDAACAVHGVKLEALFPGGSITEVEAVNRPPSLLNVFASHNPFDYLSSKRTGAAVALAV